MRRGACLEDGRRPVNGDKEASAAPSLADERLLPSREKVPEGGMRGRLRSCATLPRRPVKLALLAWLAASPAFAQESGRQVCLDLGAQLNRELPKAPDSLHLNNDLFLAARKGCLPELKRTLAAGASRLARDREGDTALAAAARAGRLEVVETLIAGATPQEARQIDMADARGASPLMLAIHAGRRQVAAALLAAGAKVDAIDAMGETALAEAAFAADEELGLRLIEAHADPATVDRYGKSPICYAAARGAAKLVERLLDAGVDVNARYGHELTALMWAAGFPDNTPSDHAVATLKRLIARGAKLDLVDDRGRSALMTAAAANRIETAKALIAAGADRALKDSGGKTALDLAPTEEMQALLR